MSANSLCFKEAHNALDSGEIEREAYLRHIVAHYGSLRHEEDAEGRRPLLLGFEREVQEIVLSEDYRPLENDNKAFIHSIFLSAFQGDVATVGELLKSSMIASTYYLRPLVSIAKLEGNSQLLRLCFENGFVPDGYLEKEHLLKGYDLQTPSTAWLDVLFEFDFRKWRTDPQKLNKWKTWRHILYMGADRTRWWIEHGGRTKTGRGLFEHSQGWPGAATFRVLLDQFGIEWFKDTGTLQLAVKHHDFMTVKLLVEAGADISEDVTDWNNDVRERRAAPLRALEMAVFAKSKEMIWYFAERGAKLPRKTIDDPWNTLPKEYRMYMDYVAELGAVEEETQS